ncbi:MAG: DUF4783 domain-containing protein [Crocinitomicaceae bacterium]|nr:DUF4783 domain-containing protein [Crocinitomicaceae bacterium]
MRTYTTLFILLLSGFAWSQPSEPDLVNVDLMPAERGATTIQQQQSFESMMVTAFKTGNAEKIASYFSDNVDLSIESKEDLYSKSQAEQILKTFFLTHKPKDFKIIHKGKSGQSEYFIGELSSEEIYRVTINSKSMGGSKRITSLTIVVE